SPTRTEPACASSPTWAPTRCQCPRTPRCSSPAATWSTGQSRPTPRCGCATEGEIPGQWYRRGPQRRAEAGNGARWCTTGRARTPTDFATYSSVLGPRVLRSALSSHPDPTDPHTVHLQHVQVQSLDLDVVPDLGQSTEPLQHQAS